MINGEILKRIKMKKYYIYILSILAISACNEPTDFSLDADPPAPPEFLIEPVSGDPNRFIITDVSEGNFSRVWSMEDGQPETSTLKSDTVFYNRMGEYEIKLFIASESGGGTAQNIKTVTVDADVLGCQLDFLNEDCSMKCWKLSPEPASVMVGPIPFSGEWFTSDDITDNQADDMWCFSEDGTLIYDNSGATFSSCQGFVDVEDYPIPNEILYTYADGSGIDNLNRITIEGIFMGVEDSGPTYDIIEVSEDKMMLLTPLKPCDGSPSTGWFTLTFLKVN